MKSQQTELARWVEMSGTQSKAALLLGVSHPRFHNWLAGRRTMPAKFAAMVEDLSGGEISKSLIVFGNDA